MSEKPLFHILSVGWAPTLISQLLDPVERTGRQRFSHLLHPRYTQAERQDAAVRQGFRFFRESLRQRMPEPDGQYLASFEREGVPTVHNMIMGDSILARLPYRDALGWATFLAKRMEAEFHDLRPDVVLNEFDGVHGSLALAVARRMQIPCFAMHFSVLPPGMACFNDRMSPAARVEMASFPAVELRRIAEVALRKFQDRGLEAAAYIAPQPRSVFRLIRDIPLRAGAVMRTLERRRMREFIRYTEDRTDYDVLSAAAALWRGRSARRALARVPVLGKPPATPYVLFGLHMQPESSIDVWAPFYSNQMHVIEMIVRSIPASHKLLVKIHKSDVSNHSKAQLQRMRAFPGVEIVRPFADTRAFIESADLVISIQGTMGLEAALLGKPVIMLGESPVSLFPSAVSMRRLDELPALVRAALAQPTPDRESILAAYSMYLRPFMPASLNDWTIVRTEGEIAGYVRMFGNLEHFVSESQPRRRSESEITPKESSLAQRGRWT